MGNQPSREGTLDDSSIQRSLSNKLKRNSSNIINPKIRSTIPPKTSSRTFTVSPVCHQLVLTNHITPLVPLTSNLPPSSSSYSIPQQNSSKRKSFRISLTARSTSSSSFDDIPSSRSNNINNNELLAREFIPIPGSSPSSPLSSSFNSKKSDEFSSVYGSIGSNYSARNSKYKSDHHDTYIYDYGTEKERDRQTRQHYVLKQVFERNMHVQLNKKNSRVLESACGVGLWSLEIAQANPGYKVVAFDIVPPSEREGWNYHPGGGNLVYKYGDFHKPLEFDDQSFDFVYQRDVATDVPQSFWPKLIAEFARVLKPGGQIELVEYDLLFKNPGPFLSKVNEWYQMAAKTIKVDPNYTLYIPEYLEDNGFVDINEKIVDIPIGEWPSDSLQRQHGYLYKEQMKTLFKSFKRWWCTELKVSSQEYDRACMEALEEFDKQKCFARWKIFTASKPSSL